MDKKLLMSTIDRLLEEAKTAVMGTVDTEGQPQIRWMTPGILRERPYSLFCVTSPTSYKALSIDDPSPTTWMIQNKALTEIVNVQGNVYKVNNPSLKAEVIEHVIRNLVVYWKINETPTDFQVLETVITSGAYFKPMDNIREQVTF